MIEAGKATIIVGATGEGKTTLLKYLLRHFKVHESRLEIYDTNAEWYPDKPLPEISDFLERVYKLHNRVIIFEDATSFFDSRSNDRKMIKMLVAKRHQKICVVLLFHAIRDIPYYIYNKCNFAFVLRTNDNDNLVKAKHPLLFDAYYKVNYEPAKAKQLRLFNGSFSPYEMVKLNVRKQ